MHTTNCKKHGAGSRAYLVKGRPKCSVCNTERVSARRKKLKVLGVEYKGGKCCACGYKACIAALQFHHIEPKHKDFSISADGHTRSWEQLKAELDKCILVCANCHAEIHHAEGYRGK